MFFYRPTWLDRYKVHPPWHDVFQRLLDKSWSKQRSWYVFAVIKLYDQYINILQSHKLSNEANPDPSNTWPPFTMDINMVNTNIYIHVLLKPVRTIVSSRAVNRWQILQRGISYIKNNGNEHGCATTACLSIYSHFCIENMAWNWICTYEYVTMNISTS